MCKNLEVTAWNLHTIKTFLTLKLSQYHKNGNTLAFSSTEPVPASPLRPFSFSNEVSIARVVAPRLFSQARLSKPLATAAYFETPWIGDCPSNQLKLCRSAPPRAQALILHWKLSIVFWNSLWEWLPVDLQGLTLGIKLELCCCVCAAWATSLLALYSRIICVE